MTPTAGVISRVGLRALKKTSTRQPPGRCLQVVPAAIRKWLVGKTSRARWASSISIHRKRQPGVPEWLEPAQPDHLRGHDGRAQ